MGTQEICAPTRLQNRECVGTENEGNFVFGKRETEESERKKVESCVIRRWFILVEFWRFRTLQRRRFIAIIGTQTPDFIKESSNRI